MGISADLAALLQRHIPVLRYDTQEPYFADAAAEWTDNPGNELRRADGTLLAAATPNAGEQRLSLSFLGPQRYADGEPALPEDRIGDPSHDYATQARALHTQAAYANRVYGHCATGNGDRVWLAYWFFYFYNDYNLIGPLIKAGLHEGDWEMIQLRLTADLREPDLAVYAQHAHADHRSWNQVEKRGLQPVVYPARGSHASYFSSGTHWTGAWFDCADGQRAAPPLALHILSDVSQDDGWATWPGRWGGTEPPPDDLNPLDDSSPRGPGGHGQYRHPDVLLETAAAHAAAVRAPAAVAAPARPPAASIQIEGDDLRIAYDAHVEKPAGLVVALGDPKEGNPAIVHQVPIDDRMGSVCIPGAAAGGQPIVHVSIATADGIASPSVRARPATLADPRGS
jgi:hypothetical protein